MKPTSYKEWLHDTLFQHHILTRQFNKNKSRIDWCVCPIDQMEFAIGDPLCFGETIEEAIENFKEMVDFKGDN